MTGGTEGAPRADGIVADPASEYGYRRPAALQSAFEEAAAVLRTQDGWDPGTGRHELVADLALEGGGVKGIGLVGAVTALAEAGYRFERVAGSSAGAIAASLIAAITKAGRPMTALRGYLDGLSFENFMPEGKLHHFLDHTLGKVGGTLADAEILSHRPGLYSGDYLAQWLGPILADLGVRTFADLRITPAEDPGMSLPPERRYRLVVHTSDITRGQLVRLPWDFALYGSPADEQDVVHAVRASMSIPFFFVPATFTARPAEVALPQPGGTTTPVHYDGGTVTWVDGGMLRNFPIDAFSRVDGAPPRWPTIGIKLSSLQTSYLTSEAAHGALGVAAGCLHTMMGEWDTASLEPTTAARTVYVDNAGIKTTDFDLDAQAKATLFLNGVAAATGFLIESAHRGGVPRTAAASMAAVTASNPSA